MPGYDREAAGRIQARYDSGNLHDLSAGGELRAHGPALDTATGQARDDYYRAISE